MSDEKESNDVVSSAMRSLTGGASIFLVGKLVSNGAGFFTNLLLTRGLGPQLYGVYSYTSTLGFIALKISNLGSDKSILKFVPQYEESPEHRSAMLLLAYLTSIVASTVLAAILFSLAPLINSFTLDTPLFTDVLRVYTFLIPFNTLSNLIAALFKSYEDMISSALISHVATPVFKLIGVVSAFLLGYALLGVVAAMVAAGFLTLIGGLWLARRRLNDPIQRTNPFSHATEFYNFSLPLTVGSIAQTVYNRVDLLMVGYFLSSSSVGVYNIAVVLATFLSMPLMAFNQLYPPIASRLYHDDQLVDLNKIYAITNRWILTITMFPFLVVLVFSEQILLVFGEGFVLGTGVLIALSAAQLISATAGPTGMTLMMTGHQYLTMSNNIVMGVLNIILNYFLIIEFGAIGAAIATGSSIAFLNIVKVIELWYLEQLFPFNFQYFKPLCAGLFCLLGLSIFKMTVNAHYLLMLVGGSTIGGILYTLILYLLGFEEAEVNLFYNIVE